MYKLLLCALFALAVADPEPEPGALIAPYAYGAPYGYQSTYYQPATTTITKTASSYVANPYLYPSPYFPHFIKKRSAPFLAGGYISPNLGYSALGYPGYYGGYSTPLVHSAPVLSTPLALSTPAHFIKKRSVSLLPSPALITPTTYAASAPLLTSSYGFAAGAPILTSAPLLSSPFGYSHFIKKRSAPLLPYSTGYIAPAAASYSYSASTPYLTSPYAAPIASAYPYLSAPFAYSSFIKK